jgi:hypothetical protein
MLAMPLEVGGFSRVEKVDPDAMMIRPEVNQLPRKFGEYLCPLGIGLRGLLIAVRNIIGTGRLDLAGAWDAWLAQQDAE